MCTARVFVQGLCTVAQAAAPLCAGFPRCGRRVCGRWVRGRGGFCFLFGSGECLRFSVSGVGAGVGPCVFGCWLVLLPSLALFGGLPLDPDYAVPDAKKKIVPSPSPVYIRSVSNSASLRPTAASDNEQTISRSP